MIRDWLSSFMGFSFIACVATPGNRRFVLLFSFRFSVSGWLEVEAPAAPSMACLSVIATVE